MPVSVDGDSAVIPVVSLLSDDVHMLSADTSPTEGVMVMMCLLFTRRVAWFVVMLVSIVAML